MSVLKSGLARAALMAALGMGFAGIAPAVAADLGGNCCADLEERIAELEATSARKGNRKVSLEISGWVNEALFFWDDGVESNVYTGTNSLEQSRFRFKGEAKIDADWAAGYTLEIGINSHASSRWDQDNIRGDGTAEGQLGVRKSNWYLKSKTFGKITMGLEGTATYHLLDDADGTLTRNYADAEGAAVAQGRFFLLSGGSRAAAGNLRWSDVLRGVNNGTPGQNGRRNIVRYDSPEFAGFVVTASWGEDDQAGAALTYKGKVGDFKLVGKAGYERTTDEGLNCHSTFDANVTVPSTGVSGKADCEWFGAAGTIMHEPTGLYVYGGYGQQNDDTRFSDASSTAGAAFIDDTDRMWFIQAGIERKFFSLGATNIFGEYRHDEAGSNTRGNSNATVAPFNQIRTFSSDIDFWSAGVVQSIDAAAMDLYVIYRHAGGDIVRNVAGARTPLSLDDFDMVMTGARIQF